MLQPALVDVLLGPPPEAIEQVLWYTVVFHTGLLVVTSLLLVYPLLAYARNVAYTEGLASLATAFFMITAVIITDFWLDMPVASNLARFLAAAAAFVGIWFFARDFVHVDGMDLEIGGFGDEWDD
ncbi:MAG: hypothetical protein ACLFMT_03790 [Halobacteriales archaeon]